MGKRLSQDERAAIASEALGRARNGSSIANDAAVIAGFLERGIPEDEILPRVNCLTFWGWKALGRSVCKGQHGVKVTVWIRRCDCPAGASCDCAAYPKNATVFHESQTEVRP
jgi:hypothetical protein